MIIIKTEMSMRKINRGVLEGVLSRLSSEACSKEGERRRRKKKSQEGEGCKKKARERERSRLRLHNQVSDAHCGPGSVQQSFHL